MFFLRSLCALPFLLLPASCVQGDIVDPTPLGVFEATWRTMDRAYCFFPQKQARYGVDWDSLHLVYRQRITPGITNYQLFDVCQQLLRHLHDGHVNLSAAHEVSSALSWQGHAPNYSADLLRPYLEAGVGYRSTAGIQYRILAGHVGYMRIPSFAGAIGAGNLSEIIKALGATRGLIIDIRSNQGGHLTTAQQLASAFVNASTTVGYMSHKTGPAHTALSAPVPIVLHPLQGLRWQKKVVLLTNRYTYSAANSFVSYLRTLPQVTLLGDTTGGGGGMPLTRTLPNGWLLRLSASPTYDVQMQPIEEGIAPDIYVTQRSEDTQRGIDTLLEAALRFLTSSY